MSHKKALLLTSRENKFYFANLYSGSGYVLLCPDKTYVLVDGRYYTDMKQKNDGNNEILLLDNKNTFTTRMEELIQHEGLIEIEVENTMSIASYQSLQKKLSLSLTPINLDTLRSIKKAEEIQSIKKACEISRKAFDYIINFIQPGLKEWEVANELVYYMKKLGAKGESFDTIVLSGERTALPHGKPSDRIIQDGDYVMIDFGAIFEHYCSDITRTFQVGQKSEHPLDKIYQIVEKAQADAIKAIKPGIPCCEIDKVARDYITSQGYGEYFTHNLGHALGILCHEDPRLSPHHQDILKPGMIFTVEPGIYIEGLGGVRIEDDILVTENGYEILTREDK